MKKVFIILGILILLACTILPAPTGMTPEAWRFTGVVSLIALFWIGNVISIYKTALIPLILIPLLGIDSVKAVSGTYMSHLLFLFFGGFTIGIAIERWNLHRRIALGILRKMSADPSIQILGFMMVTAFFSAWISNTATTIMMLPIALSTVAVAGESTGGSSGSFSGSFSGDTNNKDIKKFTTALLIGVAFAASIGGIITLVGTPPNAFFAAFMSETYGIEIGFGQWMLFGLPVSIITFFVAWFVLTKVVYKFDNAKSLADKSSVEAEYKKLPPLSYEEKTLMVVFVITAILWITRSQVSKFIPSIKMLNDAGIAMVAAIFICVFPAKSHKNTESKYRSLLTWQELNEKMPWGLFYLYGGGLAIAAYFKKTGLAVWLAEALQGIGTLPLILIIASAVLVIIFLTEITSNTATTATFLPLMAALAVGIGLPPELLAVPVTVAASFAFMLPVATPPNSVVFGSGKLEIRDMAIPGLIINLVGIVILTVLSYILVPIVFNLQW